MRRETRSKELTSEAGLKLLREEVKKNNTGKAQDFVQNYKRHIFQMTMNFTCEKVQVG